MYPLPPSGGSCLKSPSGMGETPRLQRETQWTLSADASLRICSEIDLATTFLIRGRAWVTKRTLVKDDVGDADVILHYVRRSNRELSYPLTTGPRSSPSGPRIADPPSGRSHPPRAHADERPLIPLTITDFAGRYLLTCGALSTPQERFAFTVFERAFKEAGPQVHDK